jgi:DNA topoisomerase-3
MEEIATYTRDVIRSGDVVQVDPDRLGDCPRCGQPVIAGKKGFGCSAWREGCPFVLFREYKGLTLNDDQVRELLQYHVLQSPVRLEDAGHVLLKLTDSGPLVDVPVPNDAPRRPTAKAGTRQPGKRPKSGTRRRKTATSAAEPGRSEVSAEGFAAVSLGPCPLCKSDVVEQAKAYGCSAWRQGCKFTIWKTIAGKRISVRTAQALLKQGRSPKLKGFSSKSGTTFDARLKLEGGEVRFDFSS